MTPSDEPAARQERLSSATHEADRRDARAAHEPDRPPTPEEEAIADDLELDPDVAEHYEEMAERGATTEGEGRIGG